MISHKTLLLDVIWYRMIACKLPINIRKYKYHYKIKEGPQSNGTKLLTLFFKMVFMLVHRILWLLTLYASYDNQRISCFSQQITAMAHEKSGGWVTTAYVECKIKDIIWMGMKNCNKNLSCNHTQLNRLFNGGSGFNLLYWSIGVWHCGIGGILCHYLSPGAGASAGGPISASGFNEYVSLVWGHTGLRKVVVGKFRICLAVKGNQKLSKPY